MPPHVVKGNLLVYRGSDSFRQRLVLSILSGKPVRIIDIRISQDEPGLREYEVSFIRLLDKITNGTIVELNETGTEVFFQPGLLNGGYIEHDCCVQRSIGYYLEMLLMLGFFCKENVKAVLRGVTCNSLDPSVDHIKASVLPLMKRFVIDDEGIDLKINTRGMLPLGGGEVYFTCPVRKTLRPIQLMDKGMIKRIRGIAYALRVSPAIANRMVDKAKGVLIKFLPDVYITTDQCKGKRSGRSPGFGIHLYAETTTGIIYSSECVSNVVSDEYPSPSVPEDIGITAAQRLCHEIYLGGCTDTVAQSLATLFMALGQKDVSKITIGPLSDYTISFLQHLRDFFGVTFKIDHFQETDDGDINEGSGEVLLTCVGTGYTNLSKRTI